MSDPSALMSVFASVARQWRDPEHPSRREAVADLLARENTFTEEAVAFAVNQQMSLITAEDLTEWIGGRRARTPMTVGVLNPGNVPFVELQDFLAVLLTGHAYLGTLSSRAPSLLPAFLGDVREHEPDLAAECVDGEEMFGRADAVIAGGSDETAAWVRTQCDRHGIPERRRLVRGHRFAAAVIDGRETPEELEGLAVDALLHEGFGCRNVAVVWSPKGFSPDGLLEAFAHFRGVFPAHPSTPGRLKLQQAFLEAIDAPHAFGEGLEFLMSRGEPEAQHPGHIRWAEYDELAEVREWLSTHRDRIQLVVARAELAKRLSVPSPTAAPGEAQRPDLSWCPDAVDTVAFLVGLAPDYEPSR